MGLRFVSLFFFFLNFYILHIVSAFLELGLYVLLMTEYFFNKRLCIKE